MNTGHWQRPWAMAVHGPSTRTVPVPTLPRPETDIVVTGEVQLRYMQNSLVGDTYLPSQTSRQLARLLIA